MSILVFVQQENGSINRLSKEAISGAQQLGEELKLPVNACVFNESAANNLLECRLVKSFNGPSLTQFGLNKNFCLYFG